MTITCKTIDVIPCDNKDPRAQRAAAEFPQELKKAHNDNIRIREGAVYKHSKGKIDVVCMSCGNEFNAEATNLISGQGCRPCGIKRRTKRLTKSQDQFIEEVKKIHGDDFDYSKVNYVSSTTKVEVVDPDYGSWFVIPSNLLKGQKHPARRVDERASKRRSTTQQFIEKARRIHGDKYDYSKVKYINSQTKVEIIDPDFGSWWTLPSDHYSYESPFLKGKRIGDSQRSNRDEFIAKARRIHGNLYIYNKVEYNTALEKVEIIDPMFGSWMTTPNCHLSGSGHPLRTRGIDSFQRFQNDDIRANSNCYFYIANIDGQFIKPGITNNLGNRADQLYKEYLFVSPLLCRCEAWAIERGFLSHTMDAFVAFRELPRKFIDWGGRTEIRHKNMFSMNDLRWHFDKLLRELERVGWEQLALNAS